MGVAQVWRRNNAGTALLCKGRPPRPIPPFGTSLADLITRVRAVSVFSPPAAFVIGTTKPDDTNTGATGTLTRYPATGSGNLLVTTPGAVIENLDIYGYVIVRAANVTVRNCRVRGLPLGVGTTYNGQVLYGMVDAAHASATNCLVEFCTLVPQAPDYFKYGAQGQSLTVRRSNIYHVVDGISFNTSSGSLVVEANYMHDHSFFSDSPNHALDTQYPGWTHNDIGAQISGGSGHVIRGNNILANASPDVGDPDVLRANGFPDLAYGAGITVSPDKGPVTNTLIEKNWIDGGTAGFQANGLPSSASSMDLGTIRLNRFGMGQHDYGNGSRYQIRYKNGIAIAELNTNIFDPDNPTVPAAKKGATFSVGFTGGIRVAN